MPSKTPPMSVRLKPALMVEVLAYAAANGLTPHGAVVALIDLGLAPRLSIVDTPAPRQTVVLTPLTKEQLKPIKGVRSDGPRVQIGATRPRAGSRLKKR